MKEKLALLKLLADETRLKILNLLLKEDSYVEKIACELSLTPATICYHLKKLESAGVVNCSRSQFYMIYSLNREMFDKPLYEWIKKDEPVLDTEEKYKKEVLSHFFKYGRLTQIPTQRKKREIVLAEIGKSFEKGRKYTENEVSEIIHRFHEDHCTIRREMIACGILIREKQTYWLNEQE
ncbi:MAG: metalloregulator ArsR/SmtB family transcription factor [Clostridia bacterium]|nr:metalloregulator ArsR/SmtB family transcription factor [Clostridia bacterium]